MPKVSFLWFFLILIGITIIFLIKGKNGLAESTANLIFIFFFLLVARRISDYLKNLGERR